MKQVRQVYERNSYELIYCMRSCVVSVALRDWHTVKCFVSDCDVLFVGLQRYNFLSVQILQNTHKSSL